MAGEEPADDTAGEEPADDTAGDELTGDTSTSCCDRITAWRSRSLMSSQSAQPHSALWAMHPRQMANTDSSVAATTSAPTST